MLNISLAENEAVQRPIVHAETKFDALLFNERIDDCTNCMQWNYQSCGYSIF